MSLTLGSLFTQPFLTYVSHTDINSSMPYTNKKNGGKRCTSQRKYTKRKVGKNEVLCQRRWITLDDDWVAHNARSSETPSFSCSPHKLNKIEIVIILSVTYPLSCSPHKLNKTEIGINLSVTCPSSVAQNIGAQHAIEIFRPRQPFHPTQGINPVILLIKQF